MGLSDALGDARVAFDAVAFIYYTEERSPYVEVLDPFFGAADRGELEIVTSAITLLEVLVLPYRAALTVLAERYEALLSRGRGIKLVEVDRPQLRAAAQLRASYKVRTPDALQLAAALTEGCASFLTNDRRLPRIPGLSVVQLAEHV